MAQRWIHWWFSAPSSSVSLVILTVLPQWPCLFLLSCWLSDIEKRFNWKVLNAAAATALWESRVLQLMRVFTSRLWFYGKCSVCGSWCETSAERLGDHFEKRKSTNKKKNHQSCFQQDLLQQDWDLTETEGLFIYLFIFLLLLDWGKSFDETSYPRCVIADWHCCQTMWLNNGRAFLSQSHLHVIHYFCPVL